MLPEKGLVKKSLIEVTSEHCIKLRDSELQIYSTPSLLHHVEEFCADILEETCEQDEMSVGISVSLKHFSPSPNGSRISIEATISEVEGKMITFNVSCHDDGEEVASVKHKRMVVKTENIVAKIQSKMSGLKNL